MRNRIESNLEKRTYPCIRRANLVYCSRESLKHDIIVIMMPVVVRRTSVLERTSSAGVLFLRLTNVRRTIHFRFVKISCIARLFIQLSEGIDPSKVKSLFYLGNLGGF